MFFLILHVFLLLLFSAVGLFGLVFHISGAAFLGLTLVPWEMRLMMLFLRKNKPMLFKAVIVIAAVVGLAFFCWLGDLKTALVFIAVEAYMFYLVSRKKKTAANENTEEEK